MSAGFFELTATTATVSDMPRTFVELSTFGALEAELGHGHDAAQLAQDYLRDYGPGAPVEVPLTHNAEIPLGPLPSFAGA